MMSDDDLIRRGDALNACRASEHRYEAHDAIDALPAVTQPAPDAAADRIEELEAKLAKAVEALEECVEEIDAYIQHQYPHDHPVQERDRQQDYASNPARLALAELTGGKDE